VRHLRTLTDLEVRELDAEFDCFFFTIVPTELVLDRGLGLNAVRYAYLHLLEIMDMWEEWYDLDKIPVYRTAHGVIVPDAGYGVRLGILVYILRTHCRHGGWQYD
jgi:hypothetical protein